MREASKHHMLQLRELLRQCGIDARIGMSEQIHPPRADRIEIATSLEIEQPCALTARDGHERQRLVLFHLRAWMPYSAQTTCQQRRVESASSHRIQNCTTGIVQTVFAMQNAM